MSAIGRILTRYRIRSIIAAYRVILAVAANSVLNSIFNCLEGYYALKRVKREN